MLRILSIFVVIAFAVSGCSGPGDNGEAENSKNNAAKENASESFTEKAENGKKILALVDENPVYEEEIVGKSLDEKILEEVIYAMALNNGIDDEIKTSVEKYQKSLVVSVEKKKIMDSISLKEDISEEEILEYYNENKKNYVIPNVHQITVKGKPGAVKIQKLLKDGKSVDEVVSNSPKIVVSYMKGFLGSYNDHFTSLEVGEVSDLIDQIGYNFLILKIIDIKVRSVDDVKPSIITTLTAIKKNDLIKQQVNDIAQKNNITIEIMGENKQ